MPIVILLLVVFSAILWAFAIIIALRRMRQIGRKSQGHELKSVYEASFNSEASLVDMMNRYPSYAPSAVRWAEMMVDEKNWDEAGRRAAFVREKYPEDPAAYMVGVKVLLGAREIDRAEQEAERAMKRFPLHSQAFSEFADIARRRRDWPEAGRRWAETRRRFPEFALAYLWEGNVQIELKNFDAADKIFEAALAALDIHGRREIVIQYADNAHRRANWAEAVRRWEMARKLLDRNPTGYIRGSKALRECGRTDEAERVLTDALFMFPKDPDVMQVERSRRPDAKL